MKGDFSKRTFDAGKHFHDVLMQQGRVLLDQEWNEQADINMHRAETGTDNIIGSYGAPLHNAGFAITPVTSGGSPPIVNNLQIGKGNYYVDGILCENENDFLFSEQPDFNSIPLPAEPGTYIFYLDVWLQHITALEDTRIREVALGGPDTTTRTKTIWQVNYTKTAANALCSAGLPPAIIAPSIGTMNAQSEVTTASDDPCGLNSSGGYRRLQNQLYRVEIHRAGADRAHATFKWSRDNGSVIVKCTGQEAANSNNLIVTNTGRDDLIGFKSGNWVEVIHDDNDLLDTPGILAQILTVNGNVITIDPDTIKDPQSPGATFITIDTAKNPRIRRWDSEGEINLNTNNDTWIALEDGVEVNFQEGTFRTGDYWLVPARTAIANVEWPFTVPQLPKGIHHHFAQLAIATLDAGGWIVISDCRSLFPPLTELTSLYYVGGDGQQAMPGNPLPDLLKVGVANGEWTLTGAPVKFEILSGGGALTPASGLVTTGADGIASCQWTLGADTSNLTLQVKASLLDDAGNVLPNHLPILFNASLSIAENVAYQSQCNNWAGLPPATVAEALDQLCERRDGKHLCCSLTVGTGGDFETLELAIRELQGKEFICICLLPGEHKIGENSLGNLETKMIKITSCGAEVLLFGIALKLQAEEIILEGVNIQAADFDLDTRILITAHKLHTERCSFFGFFKEIYRIVPFVLVQALFTESIMTEAEVNWSENTVSVQQSGVALGFGQRIGGRIKDNSIGGDLMLQYDTKFADLDWQQFLNEQGQLPDKQVIESKLPSLLRLLPSPLALHITGNIVGRVRTNANRIMAELRELLSGQTMREEQAAFNNLIVSDNIFQSGIGSFVAELLTMSNNHFGNNERNVLVAFAIGYRGIFTGNMDNIYFDNGTGGIIETMFNKKIINSNLIEIR